MKTITVKDLGRVVTGHTPPTKKREFYGKSYPFVKPTDMRIGSKYTYKTEEGYSDLAVEKYKTSMIPKGSTCVVCIGTLGEKMTMAHCDLFTNQSVNSIIPNQNFDEQYVYYVIKHNLNRVKALNKGTASGREFVSKNTFVDLEISVFESIETQRKIGACLSNYDDLIENNQKQIELLEEAIQRLYFDWFVNFHFPGYNVANMKDAIPSGWQYKELQELAVLKAGGDKPKQFSKMKDEKHTVPVFSNGTTEEGLYGYTNVASIQEPAVTISARGSVGYAFLRRKPYVPIVRLISCIPNDVYVGYLYLCLKNTSFESNGAAQQQITVPMIKNKKILIPESKIIDLFQEIVEPIFDEIDTKKELIVNLTEARDRLLPKLLTGEIVL